MAHVVLFPSKEAKPDPVRERLEAVLADGVRFNQPVIEGVDPLVVRFCLDAAGPAISDAVSKLCSRLIDEARAYERENRGN